MPRQTILKHRRYILFCVGGILVFLFDVLATIVLTEFFNIWHMYSYAFALVLGTLILFIYHLIVTFNDRNNLLNKFFRFVILYIVSYVIAWLFVFIATHIGVHYVISIIIISLFLSFINYKLNKNWVFRYKNAGY
jgi:putative flippase GtrA